MTAVSIVSIVEGHGDVYAVPLLLRRLAGAIAPNLAVTFPPPLRVPRSSMVKRGELERAVEVAAGKAGVSGGIMILVDADDDCPAALGPSLLGRAQAARGDIPIGLVLAKQEFEAWFLAAADSLAGRRGLPLDLTAPPNPESIQSPKAWLGRYMRASGGTYSETIDQPAFASVFALVAARSADSFDKCYREMEALLARLPAA